MPLSDNFQPSASPTNIRLPMTNKVPSPEDLASAVKLASNEARNIVEIPWKLAEYPVYFCLKVTCGLSLEEPRWILHTGPLGQEQILWNHDTIDTLLIHNLINAETEHLLAAHSAPPPGLVGKFAQDVRKQPNNANAGPNSVLGAMGGAVEASQTPGKGQLPAANPRPGPEQAPASKAVWQRQKSSTPTDQAYDGLRSTGFVKDRIDLNMPTPRMKDFESPWATAPQTNAAPDNAPRAPSLAPPPVPPTPSNNFASQAQTGDIAGATLGHANDNPFAAAAQPPVPANFLFATQAEMEQSARISKCKNKCEKYCCTTSDTNPLCGSCSATCKSVCTRTSTSGYATACTSGSCGATRKTATSTC